MASKDCPIHLNLKSYLSRLFCELNFSLPGPELRLFNPRAVTSSQHAWGFLGPGSDSIHGAVPLVWHWDPACSEDLPSVKDGGGRVALALSKLSLVIQLKACSWDWAIGLCYLEC
jgi:hypothetical protein